ncbi:MAG TPA: electron transport complex subunit RsxC [Dehalococcoidales bacterium]|nr:electron transport complex subunit RsxC [Dehalococcoidales bacterium]
MDIRLKLTGARRGAKVPESKITANSPIEHLPLPEKVIIPMQQHIGAENAPLVSRGTPVLTGQKIGESEKFISAPVHATLSGEISGGSVVINPPTGELTKTLAITSDGADKWVELEKTKDPKSLSVKKIIEMVKEAGIVGMGGAAFPTHVKLQPPKEKKIDSVILNGCECEPFVTADHRIMLEYGEQVLSGLNIIRKVLAPQNVYIGIEDNKEDAIEHLEELISKSDFARDFKIAPLKSKYPTGAEKTLIEVILGREVPIGGLPMDVGVVVQNVGTAKAIHDTIFEGKPLIERVVTVTGAVKQPKNLLVRIGTPLRNLIEYCGGMEEGANEIILGGPMMGISHFDLDFPVTKGTSCVLVRESVPVKEQECISCGRCLGVCPMRLMPTLLTKYAKTGRYDAAEEAYVNNCVECGSCAYACPARIPIVQYIKVAKKELVKRKANK